MEIVSFVLSIIAVLVAGASALYTRRQAVQSEKVTAIEQRRFHADLTPEIMMSCEARDVDGRQAELVLELTGQRPWIGWMTCGRVSAMTSPGSPRLARCRSKSTGTR